VNTNFFNLQVNPELICEFLAVFSRIEYSLKATKYADGRANSVSPSWDSFANDIDEEFLMMAIDDNELKEAINYLKNKPPKKQISREGRLTFIEQNINETQKQTQQILLMVRRVRNNLFHGGKYDQNTDNRDELLIKCSLKILSECVKIDDDVNRAYNQY
jgi:hypothetical protein